MLEYFLSKVMISMYLFLTSYIFNMLFQLVEYSKISHGSLVYEMGCHPTESLFISTSKDRPIHCFDIDGKLIASFRGINSAVNF
jgi:hypothetical protein